MVDIDGAKNIMRDTQKLTNKLEDLLNPKKEEGETNEKQQNKPKNSNT